MLYIRHSEKQYKNGNSKTYQLDPDLTQYGKDLARARFRQLLEHNPVPSYIVCSPYLRTRQTALIAQDIILEQRKILVEIDIDSELSEYLNVNKQYNLEGAFYPETINPILPETKLQFKKRVQKQFNSSNNNVWYITHGYNISTIANYLQQPIKYPNELGAIKIVNDYITII